MVAPLLEPPAPGGSVAFASPKSRTLTVFSNVTFTFAGFRSRWMMPAACAASRAIAICRAIGIASESGIGAPADPGRQIVAGDELHHEKHDVWPLTGGVRDRSGVVDLRDVRMVQRRERLRLAVEPRRALRIRGERVRQHFQRDVALQPRIARAIHLSHAAFADEGGDLVSLEAGAWG